MVKTEKARPALTLLPYDRPGLRAPSEDTVLLSDDDTASPRSTTTDASEEAEEPEPPAPPPSVPHPTAPPSAAAPPPQRPKPYACPFCVSSRTRRHSSPWRRATRPPPARTPRLTRLPTP
jgi:hypothetical protein